jgi:hypothetical protein
LAIAVAYASPQPKRTAYGSLLLVIGLKPANFPIGRAEVPTQVILPRPVPRDLQSFPGLFSSKLQTRKTSKNFRAAPNSSFNFFSLTPHALPPIVLVVDTPLPPVFFRPAQWPPHCAWPLRCSAYHSPLLLCGEAPSSEAFARILLPARPRYFLTSNCLLPV